MEKLKLALLGKNSRSFLTPAQATCGFHLQLAACWTLPVVSVIWYLSVKDLARLWISLQRPTTNIIRKTRLLTWPTDLTLKSGMGLDLWKGSFQLIRFASRRFALKASSLPRRLKSQESLLWRLILTEFWVWLGLQSQSTDCQPFSITWSTNSWLRVPSSPSG